MERSSDSKKKPISHVREAIERKCIDSATVLVRRDFPVLFHWRDLFNFYGDPVDRVSYWATDFLCLDEMDLSNPRGRDDWDM